MCVKGDIFFKTMTSFDTNGQIAQVRAHQWGQTKTDKQRDPTTTNGPTNQLNNQPNVCTQSTKFD